MANHLKSLNRKTIAPQRSWEEAVKEFQQALEEERDERNRLTALWDALACQAAAIQTLETQLLSDSDQITAREHLRELDLQKTALDSYAMHISQQIAIQQVSIHDHRAQTPGRLASLFAPRVRRIWKKHHQTLLKTLQQLQITKQNTLDELQRTHGLREAQHARLEAHAETRCRLERAQEVYWQTRHDVQDRFPVGIDPDLSDSERELATPWADPDWSSARIRTFFAALNVRKAFIEHAASKLLANIHLLAKVLRGAIPPNESFEVVYRTAYETLFLMVPVISSTFASMERMFGSALSAESFGWVLIDEAGQAAPQEAVGALWRARHAVVVGDPLQLEPITHLPISVEAALAHHYAMTDRIYSPSCSSVQRMADRSAVLGTTVSLVEGESLWVGAPLRVHRRCQEPMFSISNRIAYENTMVYGVRPAAQSWLRSTWIDVHGQQAEGHWIPDEGVACTALLRYLITVQDIPPDAIMVISPFLDVVRKLREIGKTFHLNPSHVGTIHTVQGKEAPVVVLTLGGNPERPGAKDWASATPNLLNVAVSRAQTRLYVIGHRSEWNLRPHFHQAVQLLPFAEYPRTFQSPTSRP